MPITSQLRLIPGIYKIVYKFLVRLCISMKPFQVLKILKISLHSPLTTVLTLVHYKEQAKRKN